MNKKNFSLVVLILLIGITAWYSADITQRNPETLFLSKEGSRKYLDFKKYFNEKDYLVASIESLGVDSKKRALAYISDLEERFPKLDFILPDSKKAHLKDELILKLMGRGHVAFMAIGEKDNFRDLIEVLKENSEWKLSGLPYTNFMLDKYSKDIQEKLFPVMFMMSFFLCLLITRNLVASVFIFIPSVFGALISLAAIKMFFGSMNMVTSIVPLLSFAITFSLGFHLYYSTIEFQSFKEAFKRKQKPIGLMLFTTNIGFGALLTSEIPVISHFGLLVAGLTLVAAAFSIFFFMQGEDLILKYGVHTWVKLKSLPESFFAKALPGWSTVLLSLVLLFLGVLSFDKLSILTDATKYFPKKSGIKQEMDWVSENVAGMPLYNIVIKTYSDEPYDKILKMGKLEAMLEKEFPFTVSRISPSSLVRQANLLYSENKTLPDNKFALFALHSRLPEAMKESYPIEGDYRITFLGEAVNVDLYQKNLMKISHFLTGNGLKFEVNGLYHQLMTSQDSMIKTLFMSFGLSVLLVSALAFIYFKKIKILFIFLVVNTVPVFASFIFMKLVNFSVNIATVMTYSISIGIVVDSSFHIIHNLGEGKTGFREYIKTTVNPILASSLIFILSFSSFVTNDFLPIRQFGVILSFILLVGLIFDLFVLPTLYLGSNKVGEELE